MRLQIIFLIYYIILFFSVQYLDAQDIFIGSTMAFTDYLENECGIVFKENSIPKDPFQSLADHGANIIRLNIFHPPFSSSYSEGNEIYSGTAENVMTSMQRANDAGLKTLLTFVYQSYALEDSQKLNNYVAPLSWQPIALNEDLLLDSIYTFTYSTLDNYCAEGLIPSIVSIGNESSWHRLMTNVPEDQLPEYDPERGVLVHNAGSRAVRDIALKYEVDISVCFHPFYFPG